MYWSRVKTILIFLFLFLDIVLAGFIWVTDFDEMEIARVEIEDTVAVLQKNGIEISADIIQDKRESLGIVEIETVWANREMFAKNFLGDEYKTTGESTFENDGGKLYVNEREFLYNTNIHTISMPDGNVAQKELEKINIDIDAEKGEMSGGRLKFLQEIDGKSIFETGIYVKTANGKLAEVSGYWLLTEEEEKAAKKNPELLTSITGVLISFVENPIYDRNGDKIVSIETGYSTGDILPDTTHKLVSVVPAYKITLQNGDFAMYGAINGELLYNSR